MERKAARQVPVSSSLSIERDGESFTSYLATTPFSFLFLFVLCFCHNPAHKLTLCFFWVFLINFEVLAHFFVVTFKKLYFDLIQSLFFLRVCGSQQEVAAAAAVTDDPASAAVCRSSEKVM